MRTEFAAALTNALHKEFDYLGRAADKQVPCHERFVLVVHGADAAELNAHVLNFVNRLTGLFNQHTKDGRITAIVVELQSRVEHLLHGRLNTVLLLVARADAERPLREQPGAAEERFFFKHDRFHAFLNGSIRGGKACKAAARQEIVRRYYAALCDRRTGQADDELVYKLELIMQQAKVDASIRPVIAASARVAEETGNPAAAIELPGGEVVTGKTTALNILGGMDTATSGTVTVDGRDVSSANEAQLVEYRRADVGFVFQFYNLVPNLTALENVELAAQICPDSLDAEQTLRQVGLGDRLANFPAQLSGGEQQRVSIARALAKNPKLLLCDEPTGALDYKTGKQILQLLQDTCRKQGITVIIITHNSALAPMADRLIRFKSGRVESETVQQNPVPIETIEW